MATEAPHSEIRPGGFFTAAKLSLLQPDLEINSIIGFPCKRVGRSLLLISHMHVLKLCMLAHITIIKVMCAAWTLIDWLRQIGVIRFNTWVSSPSTNKPARSCDPTILL